MAGEQSRSREKVGAIGDKKRIIGWVNTRPNWLSLEIDSQLTGK